MALNEAIFRDKLDKLVSSQQSIEQTAAWCLFHRADARRVAEVWEDYFSKADQPKRLAMVYLANDVAQNGRKRGKEFLEEFFRVLPRALRHLLAKGDDKTKAAVNKVIRVWDERKVFGNTGSKTFHELVHGTDTVTSPRAAAASSMQPLQQQQQGAASLAGAVPQLAAALQQAAVAAQQSSQVQAAVGAAMPLALGPAATTQRVVAARGAVEGLVSALQQELGSRQVATGQLRQLLEEQEGAAAQAVAQLQVCSQQVAQLDAKLAQVQAAAAARPAPVQISGQQMQAEQSAAAFAQQQAPAPWGPVATQLTTQPAELQQQLAARQAASVQQQPAATLSHSEEAASLAAALARNQNSAEALLAAFMELPQDQQEGLGAELAGLLQPPSVPSAAAPGGEMEGGNDLYDPEDL